MKKITLLLLLFVSTAFYAQTSGISYQAIIYNPNGEVIPGYNNANSPLANKNICMQFTIVDSASLIEYKEKITVSTDEYGMVNTVIGTGIQTGGYATSFANVNWSLASKSLKVGIDTFGLCSNFIEISNQLFTSVPYAFAANSADNVTGVVQILHGGTGATTVIGAKTNLGLENVDNTRDINKPISIATQAALNLKEDLANKSTNVTADGASNTKYSSVKAVKDYVDTALSNEASIRAAADLLKEDLANKSINVTTDGTSNTKYPSVKAVKDYVDVSINLGGTALTNEANIRAAADVTLTNNLAAEITNRINSNLLKEDLVNKSTNVTTDGTSNTKYPSVKAVKDYVDVSINLGGTALTNEANIRAAADVTLTNNLATEISNRTNADLLKEDLINKSTNVNTDANSNTKYPSVLAIKTYVDGANSSLTTALNAEAAARIAGDNTLTTNLAAEVTRATTVDNTLTSNLLSELIRASGAENTLTTNLAAEVTNRTNADLLKENVSNKSTNVTTDGASDTKYSSVKSVKTYVDASATTGTSALTNEATIRANADTLLQTNISTLGSTVTANAITAANATALKENSANKSTTVTLGTSDTLFPTQNAVKTYVDAGIASATIPDATTIVKGKLQLAGDLTGTAALPAIAVNAVTSAKILDGEIVNADVSATAAIADTKLATIATAGKVSNSATTATSANTPNTIVLRDASGNLAAGTITATGFAGPLTGNVTGNVSGTAANVSGTVAIANGGTGATTQNFVDLTTSQTVAGAKTFSSNASFNGQTIGKGNATGGENLAVGAGAMNGSSTGVRNTAIGNSAMQNYVGTSFDNNTSVGYANLVGLTSGSGNTSVGAESMMALTTGTSNTSIGNQSLINNTGNNNVGIGQGAGSTISTGTNNTMIGTGSNVGTNNLTNATAIGNSAIVVGSNTIQLGNTSVTGVKTSGTITAGSVTYPNTHNATAGQVLTTNASGVASWATLSAAVREVADEFSATVSQTSFTLTQTASTNSKVKMYINGVRISNTAYSVSGTTLTYVPANNGAYSISVSDRIQFDYYY